MIFEAIPANILQILAYLTFPSSTLLVSICISSLAVGFNSAMISFDYDTSEKLRKTSPEHYGYIREGGGTMYRMLVFLLLMVQGFCVCLARCFGMALLAKIGKRYLLLYTLGDQCLYFLQKAARGDLWHWTPITGALGMFVSFLLRFGLKAVVDYTGNIHFRMPGELGGAYWSFNVFSVAALSIAVIPLYFAYGDHGQIAIERDSMTTMISSLVGVWFASFCALVLFMDPKYRGSFVSLQTGKEWVRSFFLKTEEESIKIKILANNPRLWDDIRPQVREWCHQRWGTWEDAKPDWFTDDFVAQVDDDLIPDAWLIRRGGGQRRRSSLVGGLGEGMGQRKEERSSMVAPVDVVDNAARDEER